MIYYLAGYLCILISCFVGLKLQARTPVWLSLGLLPGAMLAVLRGNVGTDTGRYYTIITAINHADVPRIPPTIEPGFYKLVQLISFFCDCPRVTIALLSLMVALFCIVAFSRTKDDAIIFSLLVFPYLFYDMSMNGMRYGLAFCIAKIASDELDRGKRISFFLLAIVGASMHASAILVLILLQARRLLSAKFIISAILALAVYGLIRRADLLLKLKSYTDYSAPHSMSGLAPLLIFASIPIILYVIERRVDKTILILIPFGILSFAITQVSYAGIRLQSLMLFVLFCNLTRLSFSSMGKKKAFYVAMIFVGLLGFAARARNMQQEHAEGSSTPFLPYHFFWQPTTTALVTDHGIGNTTESLD